jgi:hypothetical protein
MATSGTYAFNPAASGLTLTAFGRIGMRPGALTMEHIRDASIEANLLQGQISANQPNLWKSTIFPIALTQGTAAYNLPTQLVAVQDIYLTTVQSSGGNFDRLLFPLTEFEYDAQPQKTTQAPPTTYMIQKTTPTPTITFWQVPDQTGVYTANVRYLAQPQDVSLQNGVTVDMPYIYLDVFVAGLSHRLSRIYAPDKEQLRKQDFLEAWEAAARTDTQDSTQIYIAPDFSRYMR